MQFLWWVWSLVTGTAALFSDHRFAMFAFIPVGIAVTLLWFLGAAAKPFLKTLALIALGFLILDAGYSLRAREDRSDILRAQVDELDDVLYAKHDEQAKARAREKQDEVTRNSLRSGMAFRDLSIADALKTETKDAKACTDIIDGGLARSLQRVRRSKD